MDSLAGVTFGRAVAIARVERTKSGDRWSLRCGCGREFVALGKHLRSGATRSCGCLRKEWLHAQRGVARTHGATGSRAFKSWQAMRSRCYRPSDASYVNYGGRGISVCDRWRFSFENFLSDMGQPPHEMSLDRVDVNGNYEPSNCRWASPTMQSRNQRSTRLSEVVVMQCRWLCVEGGHRIADVARAFDVKASTMRAAVRGRSWRTNDSQSPDPQSSAHPPHDGEHRRG